MVNGIRTGVPHGFNKGCSSKFRVGSRVRQIPEESWRIYRPKPYGNNNKVEDNCPKTLNDKKVTKGFVRGREDLELRRQVETIQTIGLLRSVRILRRVLKIEETCCHSHSSGKPSTNASLKNPQMSKKIIIIIPESLERRKITSSGEYWKWTPSTEIKRKRRKCEYFISKRKRSETKL